MLTSDGWGCQFNQLLIFPENKSEAYSILEEFFATDLHWEGKDKEQKKLIDRLDKLGELRLSEELKKLI